MRRQLGVCANWKCHTFITNSFTRSDLTTNFYPVFHKNLELIKSLRQTDVAIYSFYCLLFDATGRRSLAGVELGN